MNPGIRRPLSVFRAICWLSMPFLAWAAKRAIRFDRIHNGKNRRTRWTVRGIVR